MAEGRVAEPARPGGLGSGRKLCAAQVLSRSCKATMFSRVTFGGMPRHISRVGRSWRNSRDATVTWPPIAQIQGNLALARAYSEEL